jgi:hypothetical protein
MDLVDEYQFSWSFLSSFTLIHVIYITFHYKACKI